MKSGNYDLKTRGGKLSLMNPCYPPGTQKEIKGDLIDVSGEKMTVPDWAQEIGISKDTLYDVLKNRGDPKDSTIRSIEDWIANNPSLGWQVVLEWRYGERITQDVTYSSKKKKKTDKIYGIGVKRKRALHP